VNESIAQCNLNTFASDQTITCGDCVTLSAIGNGNGAVAFSEDFNSGAPVGWQFTQTVTISNNACGVPAPDGSDFMWMGNASNNPRDMTTFGYDLTLGGTICFDMRYSIQGDPSPCEGPDEPTEGVYLQYSTDGGTTWITINYWDPNGGNDPNLTSWNQYCATLPPGAMTSNTMIRWHQDAVSGADYDHWGIDNVVITLNDPTYQISWQHDGFTYPMGNGGGVDPTNVCPHTTTTYTAQITNGTTTCTSDITITVQDPVIVFDMGNDTAICPGECVTFNSNVYELVAPAKTPTYSNAEISPVTSGHADMDINVTGLNVPTLNSSSITSVCLTGFNFSGTQLCTNFGGCPCNGGSVGFGSTCNLDISSFTVTLTTPDGCSITLVPSGVATGTNYTNVCFVPSGGGNITGGGFPAAGSWNPSQPFSNLNGCSSNGVWTLTLDAGGGFGFGIGFLTGWNISFDDPQITAPVNYTWSPTTGMTNSTTLSPTVCPTANTTYTLTATDTDGCVTVSDDITVSMLASCCTLTIDNVTLVQPTCGNSDGQITITYSGQTTGLQFSIDNGVTFQSSNVFTGLAAGTYDIEIIDDAACPVTQQITLTSGTAPTLNASTITPASCGASDGAITINATGGTPTYQYSIDNGVTFQSGSAFTGLSATTYNIEVKDGNGCTVTGTATVTSTSAPTLNASTITPASCGASDGAITINATGGTPTYQYSIDNGVTFQSGSAFTGLSATTYNIEVKDGNGCTVTGTAMVTTFGTVSIDNLAVTPPSCPTVCDGQITATVSGGTPPYTYQWYDAALNPIGTNAATITGLCAGNYSVEVGMASGGSTTTVYSEDFDGGAPTWTLNVPVAAEGADPNFFMINDDEGGVLPPGCGVAGNGDPTLHVTSVFNPSGGAAYDAGGLCGFLFCPEAHRRAESGNISTVGYTGLTLSFDFIANGDIPNDQATVWYNAGLGWTQLGGALFSGTGACAPQGIWTAYSSALPVACENIANLQIAIQWDNNDDGAGSDPSVAINNVLITTSVAGSSCTSTDVATIADPTAISISTIAITQPSCGATDGSIVVTAAGGTGTLNYSLDNGTTTQTTTTFVNLAAGSYTISVIDGNGCQKDSTVSISASNAPVINTIAITQPSCGATDGSIVVTAAGGTGTLNYSLDNGTTTQTSNSFSALAAGSITVSVIDANGCQKDTTITLVASNAPAIDNVVPINPSCGATDGSIVITASGGVGTLNYSIDNGVTFQTSNSFTNLTSGSYIIVVKDANGCSSTQTQTLTGGATPPIVSAGTDQSVCSGTSVTLNGSGAVTYTWDNGVPNGVPFTQSVGATTYTVTGTDGSGCTATDQVVVTVIASPVVDAGIDQSVCSGTSVTLNGSGATTYSWDYGVIDGTPFTQAVGTTTYTVTGTNALCTATDQVIVTVTALPIVDAGVDQTVCDGTQVTLSGSGATTYTWDNGITNAVPFTQTIGTTTYTVSGTSAPCSATDQVSVTVVPSPTVSFFGDKLIGCAPLTTTFTNNSAGNLTNCQWTFSNGQSVTGCGNISQTFTVPGCYDATLTVTTTDGCTNTLTTLSYVCVSDHPTADFYTDPEELTSDLLTADMVNTSVGATDYVWTYGDNSGDVSYLQNPSHTFPNVAGTYEITLVASNAGGCTDTVVRPITMTEELVFYVPNTFTPDANQFNEKFQPVFTSGFDPYDYSLLIFDRWGEVIFESHNSHVGWDGTYGGKIVKDGTYIWKINFRLSTSDEHQTHYGNVNLLR